MGMGIWNVRAGDKVKVHYTFSQREKPQREWSVRVGEIGLHLPTSTFVELFQQMNAAWEAHNAGTDQQEQ